MAQERRIDILNGPNLNLLGSRAPEIYGRAGLGEIEEAARAHGAALGFALHFGQHNSAGALIEAVHEAGTKAAGLVINPAGLGHTSVALLDALLACACPVVEVHLSNVHAREDFRRNLMSARAAQGVICGLGAHGYLLALDALARLLAQAEEA